jgi:hypothetical protein
MEKYRDPASGELYAYSKWFNNGGEFEWRRCRVLRYDEAEERYAVEWASGKLKHVSRVNLRFERYFVLINYYYYLLVIATNNLYIYTFIQKSIIIINS